MEGGTGIFFNLAATALGLGLLCGCAGRALRHTYKDYSEMYSQSVNRQLLLNLARLSHDEPPYFVQLGQMNAQYTFSSGLSFSPTHGRIDPVGAAATSVVQDTLTMGGMVNAGANETPNFQFVPLNGDAFAQALNAPISDKLFYTLYDQGFHADTLLRTLVASVRFYDSNRVERILVNHPFNPTYPAFIAFAEALYNAQINRTWILEGTNKLSNEKPIAFRDIKLSDALEAMKSGYTITNGLETNSFYLMAGRKTFTLVPGPNPAKTNSFQGVEYAQEALLKGTVVFQMRTFIATMYAVAREEMNFKRQVGTKLKDPETGAAFTFGEDHRGPLAWTVDSNRPFAIRPILTLTGYSSGERAKLTKLPSGELRHHDQIYTIGDFSAEDSGKLERPKNMPEEIKLPSMANLSVFSLLSYLFAQNSIDPQKLPVQQLIQVH